MRQALFSIAEAWTYTGHTRWVGSFGLISFFLFCASSIIIYPWVSGYNTNFCIDIRNRDSLLQIQHHVVLSNRQ
jgi:hypothetical protein